MAQNRVEFQAAVNAGIQPTVTTEAHRTVLNEGLSESGVFIKDVVETIALSALETTATAAFNGSDLISQVIVSTTNNTTITINGLENGQMAKLIVQKDSLNTISFVGIDEKSDTRQVGLTELYYNIWSANGNVYALRVDRQWRGAIAKYQITNNTVGGTLDNVNQFDYQINDNILHIEGDIEMVASSSELFYELIIYNSSAFGRLKQTNKYIPMLGNADYFVGGGGVESDDSFLVLGNYSLLDTGTGYKIRFAKANDDTWPYNETLTFRFSGNFLIK